MAGWRPDEGESASLDVLLKGATRAANLKLGLFVGTANGDEDVTYGMATGVFTKVAGTGLGEKVLTDASWAGTGDTRSYAEQAFTAGAGVTNQDVNGYYIAITVGGADYLLQVERDPTPRSLSEGEVYNITPNMTAT